MSSAPETPSLITLEWPAGPGYRAIGRLVLGGVAARVDLPVDRVEELGLALDALTRSPVATGRLELEIDVAPERLALSVGTFLADPLADNAVRRVVGALVDDAKSVDVDEGFRAVLAIAVAAVRPPDADG